MYKCQVSGQSLNERRVFLFKISLSLLLVNLHHKLQKQRCVRHVTGPLAIRPIPLTLRNAGTIQGLHLKKRALATHCQGKMKDYSELGHGRKRNRKMMCCIAMGAASGSSHRELPGTASSSGQNTALTLESPSWPQTPSWHPVEVCTDSP